MLNKMLLVFLWLAENTLRSALQNELRVDTQGWLHLDLFSFSIFSSWWVLGMSRGGKPPQVQTFFVVLDHHLISTTPVITVTSLFVFDESWVLAILWKATGNLFGTWEPDL